MIQIIPAISLVGHKIARVNHCDLNDLTMYDEKPLDIAMKLEDNGIKRVHLIDLKGAGSGRVTNTEVLEMISGYTNLTIDFGGGITDDDDVRLAFEHGASTVHVATLAARDREMFSSWIISFGRNKIILSTDTINGKISTRGWNTKTDIDMMEMLEYYHNHGIQYVKCTDIVKDGQLAGPSFDLYKKILNKFPDLKLFASGGIRSVDDIDKLQDLGVYGVIFAKAFYEGKIELKSLQKFL